jgi:hypothetical protein
MPPEVVAINPAPPVDIEHTPPLANEMVPAELPVIVTNPNPHFSSVGAMIAQEFGFTGDFPKERNTPRIAD